MYGEFPPHARLAVYNLTAKQEPLLHFRNQPYDINNIDYEETDHQTQLDAVALAKRKYESEGHQGLAMTALNAKAVAFIGLVRRIKGEAMPVNFWYMRDATLPSKTFTAYSLIGSVSFYQERFNLTGSEGQASSYYGVGLSVGPKEFQY